MTFPPFIGGNEEDKGLKDAVALSEDEIERFAVLGERVGRCAVKAKSDVKEFANTERGQRLFEREREREREGEGLGKSRGLGEMEGLLTGRVERGIEQMEDRDDNGGEELLCGVFSWRWMILPFLRTSGTSYNQV